jgi:hypothetical protein
LPSYPSIIADLTKQGVQAMYQIGDRIQQAWLVDMQPTCVLLDRGGQEEALCFSNNEPVEKTRQHRTALQPVSPRTPDNSDARPLQGDGRRIENSNAILPQHIDPSSCMLHR